MRLVSKIFSALPLTQAAPAVLCVMLDDSQLVKHFPTLLKALKARIKALPASLPLAISEDEQRKRITLGKYGMDLVCPSLEFYSQQGGIKDTDGVGILARRIRDLNTILDSISCRPATPSVPTSQFFAPRKANSAAGSGSVVPAKRRSAPDSDDDPNDKNYNPPRNPPAQSEEDSDGPEDIMPPKGKEKAKDQDRSGGKKSNASTKKPRPKKLKRQWFEVEMGSTQKSKTSQRENETTVYGYALCATDSVVGTSENTSLAT
ncbi:hypothetical protein B0H13DRAFT_2280892 [Mycena leptocephala]|nr:hypothetical protein B0H13DRAFT_2280892 [Mycena leptocephala]